MVSTSLGERTASVASIRSAGSRLLTPKAPPCYWLGLVRTAPTLIARAAFGLGLIELLVSSCRMRPTSVPLGGAHVDEQAELESARRDSARKSAASSPAAPPAPQPVAELPKQPEPASVQAPTAPGKDAQSSTRSQRRSSRDLRGAPKWTRVFDREFHSRLGRAAHRHEHGDHQEAHFEVLSRQTGRRQARHRVLGLHQQLTVMALPQVRRGAGG